MAWFATEQGENIVAGMTDVPNPDKVADLIMTRLRRQQSYVTTFSLLFHFSWVFALRLGRSIMVRGVGFEPTKAYATG